AGTRQRRHFSSRGGWLDRLKIPLRVRVAQGGFMKSLRRAGSVSALACGLALVTSSTAVAAISPVLITGSSPYAACSQFDNSLTGRTFPDAEVEPQVAVHGGTAIAVWHQDRRSNGGARGIGVGYSRNGGASWTETPIALTACSASTPQALSNMF